LYGRRLSLHLMMQPAVSTVLFGNSLLTNQGILSRCLVAQPESMIGHQIYQAKDVSLDTGMVKYSANITGLLERDLPLAENTKNESDTKHLSLTKEAKKLWVAFHDRVQTEMQPGKRLAPVQGLAAKAAEHVLRLAATISLVESIGKGEPDHVGEDAVYAGA